MSVQKILIVGAGMMGKGIAQVFTNHPGLTVTLHDTRAQGVLESVRAELEELQGHGLIDDVAGRMARIAFTPDPDHPCFGEADLVVECVFEDMALKQSLFADLEGKCRQEAVFATNTSVMSPTEIFSRCEHRERGVGTHFWNPAYLIPLVEVVRGGDTDPAVADGVLALLAACGKKPVLCRKDVPGFVANRLQHALWREAFYMVQEGIADPATVDDACKFGPGLRWPVMGPMENSDLVGIQLSRNIHDYILPHLADNHQPSPLLGEMLDRGDLGFASGKGWQEWTPAEMDASRTGLREYLIQAMRRGEKEQQCTDQNHKNS